MRIKIIGAFTLVFIGVIVLESFRPLRTMKPNGAPPGYTGSPGDSLKNCTVCHGGTAIPVQKWMKANIPAEGYTPGQTYTITAFNKVVGATRFGFEVSPQDSSGNILGTMVLTDTVKTMFVGGNKYITYTNDGIESVDSMKWSFDWVAPAAGTGKVTFYGAFNSNFNHNKSNDQTFIGTSVAKENLRVGIASVSKGNMGFSVFPNPANDAVTLCFELKKEATVLVEIIDLSGKQVSVVLNDKCTGFVNKQFNTAMLPNGTYILCMKVDGKVSTQKINIAH